MIAITNLRRQLGRDTCLTGIDLEIRPNEILCLMGPSGCGKTSLLRLIAGLDRPDSGEIVIDGALASTRELVLPPRRRHLSMIFQDLALWPHMNAGQHLRFILGSADIDPGIPSGPDEILRRVGLEGKNRFYPHQLSGGEQQRLAIARAIAARPRYLLMDEPFSHLDVIRKTALEHLVTHLASRLEMGIVYVTHVITDALRLADRIAVMDHGRLVQVDDRDQVIEHPANNLVAMLTGTTGQS